MRREFPKRIRSEALKIISTEACHPRCVFKLYGELNSVRNTTTNIWLNDGVYWKWKNLHVSAYSGHIFIVVFLTEFTSTYNNIEF